MGQLLLLLLPRLQTAEQQLLLSPCQLERRPQRGEVILEAGLGNCWPPTAPHGPTSLAPLVPHGPAVTSWGSFSVPSPWWLSPLTPTHTTAALSRWALVRFSCAKGQIHQNGDYVQALGLSRLQLQERSLPSTLLVPCPLSHPVSTQHLTPCPFRVISCPGSSRISPVLKLKALHPKKAFLVPCKLAFCLLWGFLSRASSSSPPECLQEWWANQGTPLNLALRKGAQA